MSSITFPVELDTHEDLSKKFASIEEIEKKYEELAEENFDETEDPKSAGRHEKRP